MPIAKIILAFCLICLFTSGLCAQQTVPPPPKPVDEGPGLEITMKFIQDKLNAIGPLRYSVGRRAVDADRDSVFDETDEVTNVVADPQRCTISYRLLESAKPVGEESSRDFDSGYDGEILTQVVAYSQRPAGSYEAQGRPQESARPRNATYVVDLKEVKKIEVRSVEQDLNEASGGRISWTIRPSIFEVVAQSHLAGYRRQLPAAPGPAPATAAPAPRPALAPAPKGAIIGGIFLGGSAQTSAQARPRQVAPEPLPREAGVFSVDDEELAKRLARALLHGVELCTPDKKAEPF